MSLFPRILILLFLIVLIPLSACSYNDRGDIPDPASGNGNGDSTNTLRYQNRSLK